MSIWELYEESLVEAKRTLSTLRVAEGREPAVNLGGWVFEQTVRYCLSRELIAIGSHLPIREQVSLGGRARVDVLVGNVAIETKVRGSFGECDSKYGGYRQQVERRGWVYFYLTLQESHAPYRKTTETCFGADRAFFLDTPGNWYRFVSGIVSHQN